ncbi:MAG: tRNA pseudouridine(55) synthase TruB [Saprospiraceae bacterium]
MTILHPDDAFPDEFPKGAVMLMDKPLAWTSFDVVNKVRYLLCRRLGVKKLKIGHAGTLDPLATGLLVLCTGEYTKKIETLQSEEKEYAGTITFGATTASFDREKPVDATFPTAHLTDALLHATAQRFLGEIEQVPPMFSAVKVDGRRLYKNARTGEEMELAARRVYIGTFEVGPLRPVLPNDADEPVVVSKKGAAIHLYPDYAEGIQCDFRVVCGKGTYIRSLALDFGAALGTGAYLSSLRRTRNGAFSVSDAWTVDALEAWIRP